ncbi:hypothetical protein N431DRAFT_426294 [Stipitochalara longipes BDJ]|nr:hypothetical protein N431DRAFT_426294 [Stipitochalara longipes BDJ]
MYPFSATATATATPPPFPFPYSPINFSLTKPQIPTGLPCITVPTTSPSPTSFIFTLPPTKPFSHICVFLLPGIALPPNTAAAVYIKLPSGPDFKFLGGVGPGKESAVFKISGLGLREGGVQVDMDAPEGGFEGGEITLGISLESADSVTAQMAALHSGTANPSAPSNALVVAGRGGGVAKVDTVALAQRIIKNAFNFLASFSGNLDGGVEVVPLKAFEEWWKKFEGRIRSDPGFLERDGD